MKKTLIISDRKKGFNFAFLAIILLLIFLLSLAQRQDPSDETVATLPSVVTQSENSNSPLDNNLPIIVIDTYGQAIDANIDYSPAIINEVEMSLRELSPRYEAILRLYEPGENGYTSFSEANVPTLDKRISINVRGQSSLANPKKQYTIRFIDEDGMENPVELLGMPKHDKWVLNASYSDKSLIRNYLAFKMAGQIMEYTPEIRFVEVYLNDKGDDKITFKDHYLGVYLLIEKIERGENRVKIETNSDNYRDISFIIARDKIKQGDIVLQTNWSKLMDDFVIDEYGNLRMRTVLTTVYPGASSLTENHISKIENYLNDFEYALMSSEFTSFKNGYRQFIDVDSFADLAIINEIFKNIDGGDVSTYFYKDIGGKMKAGPVWDFDLTLGNTSVAHANEPTGFRMVNTPWYDRLFQDSYFANRYINARYKRFRETIWPTEKILSMIDEAVIELGPAVSRNLNRWHDKDLDFDYEQEINQIKEFLSLRLDWMDENIHLLKRLVENQIE